MSRSTSLELRELLVGTWTGIALIAECLFEAGAVDRDEVLSLLSQGETLAKDRRFIALAALRKLIELGADGVSPVAADRERGKAPPLPRC